MSTSNFKGCGEFGVWAYVSPENDEDSWYDYEQTASYMSRKIDDLNAKLDFYKLGLEGGYYYGMEIVLLEEPSDSDMESIAEIYEDKNNAYMPWWNYGDNVQKPKFQKKAYQKYLAEWHMINDWLNTVASENGFVPLHVTARFSTGETWYKEAPRSEPEAPVNPNAYFFSQSKKRQRKSGKGFVPFLKRRK